MPVLPHEHAGSVNDCWGKTERKCYKLLRLGKQEHRRLQNERIICKGLWWKFRGKLVCTESGKESCVDKAALVFVVLSELLAVQHRGGRIYCVAPT